MLQFFLKFGKQQSPPSYLHSGTLFISSHHPSPIQAGFPPHGFAGGGAGAGTGAGAGAGEGLVAMQVFFFMQL